MSESAASGCGCLVRISAERHRVNCFKYYFQIKNKGPVFNVIEIVFCPFGNRSIAA